MDKKNTNIKERILQIAKDKGFSYEYFLSKVELKYANFKGRQKNSGINSNSIERIVSEFPDIDLHWLITGKHKHIETPQPILMEDSNDYCSKNYKEMYYELLEENRQINKKLVASMESNQNLKKDNQPISG